MTFCRVYTMYANYTLSGCSLDSVKGVDDLGVLLNHKLQFSDHISAFVNKARGVLGFIKRWSKEFDDPCMTKSLFISLVRPMSIDHLFGVLNTQFVRTVLNGSKILLTISLAAPKLGCKPFFISLFQ